LIISSTLIARLRGIIAAGGVVRVSWRDMDDGGWKKLALPFMCGDPNECADVSAACAGYATCPDDEGEDRLGDLRGNEYGLGGDRGGRTWGDAWSIPGGLLGSIVKGSFRKARRGWVGDSLQFGAINRGGQATSENWEIGTAAVLLF
jgi:hypothetical protein